MTGYEKSMALCVYEFSGSGPVHWKRICSGRTAPFDAIIGREKGGKLSFRLRALANHPLLSTLSVDDRAAALSVAPEGPGSLMRNAEGKLLVYVGVNDVSEDTLQKLGSAGAEITHVSEQYLTVTAYVDLSALTVLEGLQGVSGVREVLRPQTSSTCPQGVSVSEGDAQLNAASARSNYGLTGSGVNIGVLSDSYNKTTTPTSAATDVSTGDLPGTTNTCSGSSTPVNVLGDDPISGGTDEGRAMLQILHDLAPGAALSFYTAYNSITAFASNITSLRNTAGADIITDDVTYFEEPFFQEGPVNVAISTVVNDGALYFTSAGNNNFILEGNNVGSYEAPSYRPTACPSGLTSAGDSCHNFEPSGGVNSGSGITLPNNCRIRVDFQWNEPWYGLSDDFDIYLLSDSDIVVAWSNFNNFIGPFQSPFEFLSYANTTGSSQHYRIVIVRYSGSGTPRLKYIFYQNGNTCPTNVQYSVSNGGDIVGPTIMGHSATSAGFSVAAVPYNNSTVAEGYSSRGPATHYFGPVIGTTPAAAIRPEIIQQPDFAATDGGCSTFFGNYSNGCYRFYGTSAAAPHAAGVTALLRQQALAMGAPTLTLGDAEYLLKSTARAVGSSDTHTVGAGLLDANAAVGVLASATYRADPVIRTLGTSTVSSGTSIQAVYDSRPSSSGEAIKILAGTYGEDLNFDSNISVALKGGFSSKFFLSQTEYSTISSLTIGQGAVTAEYLVLR